MPTLSEKVYPRAFEATTKVPVVVGRVNVIEQAFEARLAQDAVVKGHLGALVRKDGAVWYFDTGCLCYVKDSVFEIHGDIYKKWVALGGIRWGKPDTDESPCPDGTGRYNHFNNDSATIMWSPATGANAVWGDIRLKWAELGWERSYLGYPCSDEVDFPDGGRVNAFQRGGIYWWPDTGAIDCGEVAVHYTGLVCIKETGELSGADEPYVVMGVVSPFGSSGTRSQTYGGVDSNTSRPDLVQLYRGQPNGIALAVQLMENDQGDPEKYKAEIVKAMTAAHQLGTAALGLIPIVGPGIAAIVGPLIQKFIPAIGKAVSDLFGFGDDVIGRQTIVLTGKDLLTLAKRTNNSSYKGIGFKCSTNNLKGANANYKVYFGIVAV